MTARSLALPALFAAVAGGMSVAPAADADRVTGANYALAQKWNADYVRRNVFEAAVSPQWVGKTDEFWYAQWSSAGTKYWRVDPTKKTRLPLFDEAKLAASLSELARKPIDLETFAITRVTVGDDGQKMKFVFNELQYEYEFAAAKLVKLGKPPVAGGFQPTPEMLARMTDEQRQQFEQLRRRTDQEKQQDQKQDEKQDQKQDDKQGTPPPPAAPQTQSGYKTVSPDKKKYVYSFKNNLYIADEGAEEKATQLTKDGEEDYTFAGGGFGGAGGAVAAAAGTVVVLGAAAAATDRKTRAAVTWSPDSKFFYATRTDARNVKDLFLVDSIAAPRPALEKYKYPMPGEDGIRKTELFIGDAAKNALTRVTPKWKDERYSSIAWGKAEGELTFIRRDRLRRNLEMCTRNAATGVETCRLAEGFEAAYLETQPPRPVGDTGDTLWWSERTGWGHFYRYGADGKLKNAVTSGGWRASRIVDVDVKAETVYFAGNAREPGENVYFQHLYRVKLDGTGLTLLDPSETPAGKPQPGGYNQTSVLSPTKKFVVTTSSAIDAAPFATVRDDAGKLVMHLESTDLAALKAAGWQAPVPFTVKAADGVTDLYGNMWTPFDFDPKKQYPVVANVYPGPQTEGVTHRFTAYSTTMQLAQLGFIVVQVGHRGGSPERSKAYHSFGYFNLRDYGLVDKKAALEHLAAKYPFVDLTRVGIYGHSGGGFMSAAAVLQPPYNDFFKAAVASAGNHDNNIYNDNWSETYHGMKEVVVGEEKKDATTATTATGAGTGTGTGRRGRPPEEEELERAFQDLLATDPEDVETIAGMEKKLAELQAKLVELKKSDPPKPTKFEIKIPTNAELASNLKGHLLLVHGEVDNNVHPANTMRLADALIKANKRFELLIIPGARHGFGTAQPYFTRRMWDFFGEHLLGDRQTKADILDADGKRK